MKPGVLLAVGSVGFEAGLLEAVASADLHVVRRCVDVPDLLATAAGRQAQVAVVTAQLRGLDVEVVQRLRDEQVAVVGVTEVEGADEAALRGIGVETVVALDDLTGIAEAVTALPAAPRGRPSRQPGWSQQDSQPRRIGRLVAVWGPTGAPGRTTVATGLAATLAESEGTTLLVDADVYGGTVAASLGMLDEASGLLAAARTANAGTLGVDELAGHARSLGPRLSVLTGLPRADRWNEVRAVLLRRVLEAGRRLADHVVVDCGFSLELDEELSYDTAAPRRNGATIAALEEADVVVLVGGADSVSLGRLVRAASEVATVVPGVAPYVVVNRVRDRLGWPEADIVQLVGRTTHAPFIRTLPDDPVACDRSLVHGQLVTEAAPDSKLVQSLRLIAAELVGRQPSRHARRRSRRLQLVPSRRPGRA